MDGRERVREVERVLALVQLTAQQHQPLLARAEGAGSGQGYRGYGSGGYGSGSRGYGYGYGYGYRYGYGYEAEGSSGAARLALREALHQLQVAFARELGATMEGELEGLGRRRG